MRSLLLALGGTVLFFALGIACLALSRFDSSFASVWLPNAAAVSLILLGRARNEVPIYCGLIIAIFSANIVSGVPSFDAFVFTIANLSEILAVTFLTRRACGSLPDMNNLAHLGHFLVYGGVIGPAISAVIAAFTTLALDAGLMGTAVSWFLADSMGMILLVPAVLLFADSLRGHVSFTRLQLAERVLLMMGGLLAVFFVFQQDVYPLLFLVPPVTLLVAFRIGGLGTALYVPIVAIVASWMTYSSIGPIYQNHTTELSKISVLQAFIAANFLSGLPIAAILAGRRRLTQQLEDGQRELSLLTDSITDAVLKIDTAGVCTYASTSVRDVLGRAPEDLVGKLVAQVTHAEAREPINDTLGKLLSGESDKERLTYRRFLDDEEGTPVFIEADCAVTVDPQTGERNGIVVSARDVTERVELELLLTRARRNAENAARSKSEFLANMSHEIRTPMNGVLGFAELMLQSELEPEHRRHTEMIVQSGRSMMLLLNDILDLSKIEAGQIAIDKSPVDLLATLSECIALQKPHAEKKGLELKLETVHANGVSSGRSLEGAQGPWVVTDALRLRQIVLNLIANAVKFTEAGTVVVSCLIEETQFHIAVRDTGIGISPARLEMIFAPFTQGESDTARRFGGTGLGLTISRQLAELLGGTISVTSEPGVGSEFSLILPTVYAQPEIPVLDEFEGGETPELPQSARILLVEDHDVNRMLATEMLERCGQSVAEAHDGNEAIAMVIDAMMRGKPYDLVFMDIQMPGCDGYAATRAIRAEGITADSLPIIALTANAFPEDIAAARKAGMQGHLAKPLVFAELAQALQRWLPTRIVESDASEACEAASSEPPDEPPREHTESEQSPASVQSRPAKVEETAAPALQRPSPELLDRWTMRRSEAIEAVREILEEGVTGIAEASPEARDHVAGLLHKLAGTAAIFGEPELGNQAAALEHALRHKLAPDMQEALALELLSLADSTADAIA